MTEFKSELTQNPMAQVQGLRLVYEKLAEKPRVLMLLAPMRKRLLR